MSGVVLSELVQVKVVGALTQDRDMRKHGLTTALAHQGLGNRVGSAADGAARDFGIDEGHQLIGKSDGDLSRHPTSYRIGMWRPRA
ncbi:MAG: hypothetical protein ACRDRH_21575 [Pseudonocardia sp.]